MREAQTTGRRIRGAMSALLLAGLAAGGCGGMDDYGAGGGSVGPGGGGADLPPGDVHAGEKYEDYGTNGFVATAEDNLATFGADVDTGSYTLMRRDITAGRLPAPAGVRVEEYVNYFRYADPPPRPDGDVPFAIHLEAAPSRFGEGLHLLRVGIKGMELAAEERPPANLVFLVDVSGSMQSPDKIGLVQHALTTLTRSLRPDDTIGIVTYAGREGVALEPTPVEERGRILDAIEGLTAGGSTNGEAGIRAAYALAEDAFRRGGINRVILCSDGDFNVGLTGDALVELIEEYRERDITLSVLGFGAGNYNDRDMEKLADHGNGNYAYIDGRDEVDRVLREELTATLTVIAKDVKIQVELDRHVVRRYRLIGYENRDIADDDFRDDRVDAGEIGAGHAVTAFLELELADGFEAGEGRAPVATVRVRYKAPDGDEAEGEVRRSILTGEMGARFDEASPDLRFGAAVVEFAEILRRSPFVDEPDLDAVLEVAAGAAGEDEDRAEFLDLVEQARTLLSSDF